MKSGWKWIILGIVIFVLAFCVALPLFGAALGTPARMLLHSQAMPFGRVSGGGILDGGWSLSWIGWLIRGAFVLFGLGALAAVIFALLRKPAAPAPATLCPGCGKPLQTGWVACPHCGKTL